MALTQVYAGGTRPARSRDGWRPVFGGRRRAGQNEHARPSRSGGRRAPGGRGRSGGRGRRGQQNTGGRQMYQPPAGGGASEVPGSIGGPTQADSLATSALTSRGRLIGIGARYEARCAGHTWWWCRSRLSQPRSWRRSFISLSRVSAISWLRPWRRWPSPSKSRPSKLATFPTRTERWARGSREAEAVAFHLGSAGSAAPRMARADGGWRRCSLVRGTSPRACGQCGPTSWCGHLSLSLSLSLSVSLRFGLLIIESYALPGGAPSSLCRSCTLAVIRER